MPRTMTNMRGTNSARKAARRRVHGVVNVIRTTSEIDTATLETMSAADVRPWLVSPTGVPNQDPSGTTMSPGVTKLKAAGITTMPVKIGTKSHTRLMKKESGIVDATARSNVAA